MDINDKLLDAIEILVKSAIESANFDRTIQAQIIKCENEKIGKYRCQYQEANFIAYSNNSSNIYKKGETVYVLMTGDPLNQGKIIIGKKY